MLVTANRGGPQPGEYTSPERLYLDKDGKVVKADDPNRVSLLVGAGGVLSAADAEKYGLTQSQPVQIAPPEAGVQSAEEGEKPARRK